MTLSISGLKDVNSQVLEPEMALPDSARRTESLRTLELSPDSVRLPGIRDYAAIGDCRTAALVSRSGSIDWLCLPHFSAPSVFGALLDPQGGRFRVQPSEPFSASRRYVGETNVLETTFTCATGTVRVVDLMPLALDAAHLQPMREVLRMIEGVRGAVPVAVEISPRPCYGRKNARLEPRGKGRWAWTWGNEWLGMQADTVLASTVGSDLHGRVNVRAGERHYLSLSYTQGEIGSIPSLGVTADARLNASLTWWQEWSQRCRYALALKLMTCAITGAVIAAPTTSLPEALGGQRNWDYRYCWLRDAALTMRAFTRLGYMEEARRFLDWLLHATRLTWPDLGVLYDIYGRPDLRERELDHWQGFLNSRPVRIGNAAHEQLQLDVYGAVCYAACNYVESGGRLTPDEQRLLRGIGRSVCRRWHEPDHGIWEIRATPRHYTFSKVMCWTVIDCLLRLHHLGQMQVPLGDLQTEQRKIEAAIERHGFNAAIGSYVGVFDGDEVDASALLMCCLGYRAASDARIRSTYARIQERLGCNGLMYRYESGYDALPGAEGAFGICSFWAVDGLSRRGDHVAAHRLFDDVVRYANDVGLFSEEIDPATGDLLGNFPQAYTHVGLINAAITLCEAQKGAPPAH
jgi:GH15 family glucan-1,4-alpha-glucosidase